MVLLLVFQVRKGQRVTPRVVRVVLDSQHGWLVLGLEQRAQQPYVCRVDIDRDVGNILRNIVTAENDSSLKLLVLVTRRKLSL